MIMYEIRKNMRFSFILLFAFVLLLEFVSIRMGTSSIDMDNQDEKYYIEYTQKWNGVLTKSKEDEIIREREYIELISSQVEEKKNAYLKDEITKDEYNSYLEELSYCRNRANAFDKFYKDYEYVKSEMENGRSSAKPEIFYKEYWKRFLSPDSFDYFAVILIAFFSISVGFIEKDSLMTLILYSSEKGRYDILKSKMKVSAIIVGIMALIINLAKCFIYYKLGYLPNESAPISSLEFFSGTGFSASLSMMAFIGVIGNILSSIIISQILVLLSYILSKKMTVIVIVAVGTFGIEFIKGVLPVFYAYMPGTLLNIFNIFRYAARGENIFVQMILIFSIPFIYVAIKEGLRYWCRHKLKF